MSERLTDRQRHLAAHPRHLALARAVASKWARRLPRLADEIYAVARLGLVDAAVRFDEALGVKFATYARRRIAGQVLDFLRQTELQGFRRRLGRRPELRTVCSGDPSAAAEIGWEIESVDEVLALTSRLPPRHREVMRLIFTRADVATPSGCAAYLGLSRGRISQIFAEAADLIRQKAGAPA